MTYRGQGVLLPCMVTALPGCLASGSVQALGGGLGKMDDVCGNCSELSALAFCLIHEPGICLVAWGHFNLVYPV